MSNLQEGLSDITPDLLDFEYKKPKVDKMLKVLESTGVIGDTKVQGTAVDIGCSAGFFCEALADYFTEVIGIDIDDKALKMAEERSTNHVVQYKLIDDDTIPLADNSAKLIVCNHVYEHVPSSEKLFAEIHRVLEPNGVCYLGAASKLTIIEPHFKLPFLSWLPKFIAHPYMRLFKRGDFYYENLRTPWGIKKLITAFEVEDVTLKILKDPASYAATDMINENGIIPKIPLSVLKLLHPLLPSYILILRKK